METKPYQPLFIIIGIMAATVLALAVTVDVDLTDEAGIYLELPSKVGQFTGEELRFCQRSGCYRTWPMSELEHPDVCPNCEGELRSGARAEIKVLPKDTQIHKKQYLNPDSGISLNAGIVLSGNDRTSIHRPELCLSGQGSVITNQYFVEVPIQGRKPLDVKVLELERTAQMASGKTVNFSTFYAYWFVGRDRETAVHTSRMFYMAADRIFRNVAHRWSYISVSGVIDQFEDLNYEDSVVEFISQMYPHIIKHERLKPKV